jgi:ATP-grasp domain-containing protein
VTTLVLPPRYTEDSIALSRAASRAGWAIERLPSWHIPSLLREEDTCLYGEPLFAIHASEHLGLHLIETPYDWLIAQPRQYVQRAIQLMTVKEAREVSERRFIKPAGEKFFRAAVFASGRELPPRDAVSDAVPVLAIEPVSWEIEFRCFVLERKCVAMSSYLIDGELARDATGNWLADDDDAAAALAFIEKFLGDPTSAVPPAAVIDIGRIRDRGWALVEANPAWGSGIYGCDPDAVLTVVRRSCAKRECLKDADRVWVIDHLSEDYI